MKKVLIALPAIAVFGYLTAGSAFSAPGMEMGTSPVSRNFSTIQQYQFEKEETLDFIKDPQEYKVKREKKNKYLDYQEGKVDVSPSVQTQYQMAPSRPGSSNLQFVKDENGRIKIKNMP